MSPADDQSGAGPAPRSLVLRLRDEVVGHLGPLVDPAMPVALVDFPNHANGGDTAIWMGELAALRRLGIEPAYVASYGSYSPAVLRRRLGRSGTILLHGGGNFGDVWPTFQGFREELLADQTSYRVVQLPQSLHFSGDPVAIARARAAVQRHPDAHLLVRDRPSEEFARERLGASSVRLCPDAAFALGPLTPCDPDVDVLLFARTDKESDIVVRPDLPPGVVVADWAQPDLRADALRFLSRAAGYPMKRVGTRVGALESVTRRLYARLGGIRLSEGLDLLSRGRVVVTDRLHGHILSLLLGRPHVLLDNNYGKNRRFHEQWTRDSPITRWASGLDEALEHARSLVSPHLP